MSPIQDWDGTTAIDIKTVQDWNGTTAAQIGKVYDNDGTTDILIYTSEYLFFPNAFCVDTIIGSADPINNVPNKTTNTYQKLNIEK